MLIILSIIIALLYAAILYYTHKVENFNELIKQIRHQNFKLENEVAELKHYFHKLKRSGHAKEV